VGKQWPACVASSFGKAAGREIKEWLLIMAELHSVPVTGQGKLAPIPTDQSANQTRAIQPVR